MANVGDKCPGCGKGVVQEQPGGFSQKSKKSYPAFMKCSVRCGWTENFPDPPPEAAAPAASPVTADTGINRRCALEQAVLIHAEAPATVSLILGTAEQLLAWLEGKASA